MGNKSGARATLLLALCCSMLLVACAGPLRDSAVPPENGVGISRDTHIGRETLAWSAARDGQSGFVSLVDGIDALAARLRLIEQAQVSIDAQYFLIKQDEAAGLFIGKLLRAADRGVRVRLLIDDIFTPGLDLQLSQFNAHPNVEVRLFNPVSRRGPKYWNYLMDFQRANRRMHNKSFIVDDGIVIVGGRNIANEYFAIRPEVEFIDFDLLAFGPVAMDVGVSFDQFWNSRLAVPIDTFGIAVDEADLDAWRERMEAVIDGAMDSNYARAMDAPMLADIRAGRITAIAADAEVVSDSPAKLKQKAGSEEFKVLANALTERFEAAQTEVIIITPYYVPGEAGARMLEQLCQRGVQVVVVTNSLASTNHVSVHSGYARYRQRLLAAGVVFYELRNDLSAITEDSSLSSTLHTKAVLIDRQTVFIGSLNFDPRSIDINTEMGLFVESPALAAEFAGLLLDRIEAYVYRPTLTERGDLRWVYRWGPHLEVLDVEPQTSRGRRFSARFYGWLPIEGQL